MARTFEFAQQHPRGVRVICAIVGSLAAGYLWAAVTGHGVHGLKSTVALDKTDSYPDANVVFLTALGLYTLALFGQMATCTDEFAPRTTRWCAVTAFVGGCGFVGSLLVT